MSSFINNKKAMTYFLSSLVIFAVLILASCSATDSPAGDPIFPASPEAALITEDILVEPPQVDSKEPFAPSFTSSPFPDQFVTESPSQEPDMVPTVRPDLLATDPKGVVLASGKLQLIEFFAFW